jgi:hypothetical protein
VLAPIEAALLWVRADSQQTVWSSGTLPSCFYALLAFGSELGPLAAYAPTELRANDWADLCVHTCCWHDAAQLPCWCGRGLSTIPSHAAWLPKCKAESGSQQHSQQDFHRLQNPFLLLLLLLLLPPSQSGRTC